MTIPSSLAPFFQEYNPASLDPLTAAPLIFERTLQLGHRISVDLDFFSPTEDIPTLRRERVSHQKLT